MAKIEDGGHAFPFATPGVPGMSLRDWFAGQALMGAWAAAGDPDSMGGLMSAAVEAGKSMHECLAEAAYRSADAMIQRRAP